MLLAGIRTIFMLITILNLLEIIIKDNALIVEDWQ